MSGTLCSLCNKRLATITISEMDDEGQAQILPCCHHCLERLELHNENPFPPIHEIIQRNVANTVNTDEIESAEDPFQQPNTPSDLLRACPDCGLTWQEFLERNRFGCARDVEVFADLLVHPLHELHGQSEHRIANEAYTMQPTLTRKKRLRELKKQLEEALLQEAFEEAAILRDHIKEIERDMLQ